MTRISVAKLLSPRFFSRTVRALWGEDGLFRQTRTPLRNIVRAGWRRLLPTQDKCAVGVMGHFDREGVREHLCKMFRVVGIEDATNLQLGQAGIGDLDVFVGIAVHFRHRAVQSYVVEVE